MSYDVSMRSPHASECSPDHGEFYHLAYPCPLGWAKVGSPTTNLADMFRLAFSSDDEPKKYGLRDFDGMLGRKAYLILIGAISRMKARPDDFRALNPPNGWGTYEGAVEFLERLARACEELPDWTIVVT